MVFITFPQKALEKNVAVNHILLHPQVDVYLLLGIRYSKGFKEL